jgi:hypothetical protein
MTKTHTLLILFASLLAGALYFTLAPGGFPLDDAWIHQTYARNLATLGEWSFIPGTPSAGSTSPLWTVLLTPAHLLGLDVRLWASALGLLALCGLGIVANQSAPSADKKIPWLGLLLVLEWHLVWAAMSGMETPLHALIVTGVLVAMLNGARRHLLLGLVTGLSVWVRPDGLTLLAPLALAALVTEPGWRERALAWGKLALGFFVFFAPYLLFNYWLSGDLLPNTFYAKQSEYAELYALPLWQRYAEQLLLPLVGVGVALAPGFVFFVVQAIRTRDVTRLLAVVWFLGYLGMYALRLPVTYQHGRYIMPAMPIFFLLGYLGTLAMRPHLRGMWARLVPRVWQLSVILLVLAFLALGALTYSDDVALIDSEMVATARWVEANIPPGTLIAAHDIGALGYFAPRPLVDLAGLVSPEVIPFLRDEAQLAAYLDQRGVQYLVTFPDWYAELPSGKEIVFENYGMARARYNRPSMMVYRWR